MDVTVYTISSRMVFKIIGDVHQAIIDHQDDPAYEQDQNGDPLLEAWDFNSDGDVGPIDAEEAEKGFTRYNKTIEFEWKYVTTKS